MDNSTYYLLHDCIKNLTNIPPGIYFRKNSSSVMVVWEGKIPDELATIKIEEALKQFGTVLPNHCRKANFVSFKIIH